MGVRKLLWSIELGGYPDFTPLYQRLGYQVTSVTSGRKAQAYLKQTEPDAIVAEFNFQPDFRDRTSGLESLLAVAQRMPDTRVVVFYDPSQREHLEKLRARFPRFIPLTHPIDERQLEEALR